MGRMQLVYSDYSKRYRNIAAHPKYKACTHSSCVPQGLQSKTYPATAKDLRMVRKKEYFPRALVDDATRPMNAIDSSGDSSRS